MWMAGMRERLMSLVVSLDIAEAWFWVHRKCSHVDNLSGSRSLTALEMRVSYRTVQGLLKSPSNVCGPSKTLEFFVIIVQVDEVFVLFLYIRNYPQALSFFYFRSTLLNH